MMGSPEVGWPGALPPIEFSTALDVRIDSVIAEQFTFADVHDAHYHLYFMNEEISG